MPDEKPAADAPTKEQLKGALKAFKKRLKFTRLDQESKLTRRPVTSGQSSDIVAIMPPVDYPPAVWDELVRQGKLRKNRHGLYELIQE
jgi:hypothetical protein